MAKYLITEKAGRFVAGHRNTGVGTALDLLPFAAEYEIRLGTLVPVDLPPLQVEAAELPDTEARLPDTEAEPKPEAPAAGKRKRRR
jgi:hypothetical protein